MGGRIEQMRRQIDKAIEAVCSRIGEYVLDTEKIGEDYELNVSFSVDPNYWGRVTLLDAWIYTPNSDREYKNVGEMLMQRIGEAVEQYNEDMEANYVDGLTVSARRNYYADIA